MVYKNNYHEWPYDFMEVIQVRFIPKIKVYVAPAYAWKMTATPSITI